MSLKKNDKGILLEVGTNEVEFLRFGLGKQIFGINVAKVRQVLVYQESTIVEIPGTPDSIKGTFCFRGSPIAVIDLDIYFNRAIPESDAPRLLLVCEFNQTTVGFIVDSVDRIMRCSWNQFSPLAQNQMGTSDSTVVGTIIQGDEMIAILDVEAVLAKIIPSVSIEAHIDEPPPAASANLDRSKYSIVYCEDSTVVQKVLLKSLTAAGFKRIKLFANGADGYEYLKSSDSESTDIVISDIEMPQMDGLSLCKAVRGLQHHQNTPFVFFSSTVSDEMRRKCEQVGGNASFSKPEVSQLVEAIDSILTGK